MAAAPSGAEWSQRSTVRVARPFWTTRSPIVRWVPPRRIASRASTLSRGRSSDLIAGSSGAQCSPRGASPSARNTTRASAPVPRRRSSSDSMIESSRDPEFRIRGMASSRRSRLSFRSGVIGGSGTAPETLAGFVETREPVRDALHEPHGVLVERGDLMAVDVDLGVDPLAPADQDHELRARLGAAGEVVLHQPHVRDVDVAAFGDRGPAYPPSDADEHVIGGSADEGAEPEHAVGEELVDAGPVKPLIQVVEALYRRHEQALE